jgi:carboxyl-terminal processing protease
VRIFIPKSVLILILFILTLSGFKYGNDLFEFSKHLEIFSHVYKTVQEEYVEEVPASEMAQIAIKNMLKNLDPYTVFYSEYQAEEALIERQGEYGGVGCRMVIRNQFPMVLDLEKGYGFDQAQVKHGDIILKVGDISLKNRPIDELMQYFRGAPQTTFKITLLRHQDTLVKTITRSLVEQKSVSYNGMLKNQYGYIKLDEFGRDCAQEIAQALKKQIDSHNIKGLVLDLRNNGGGLLDQAVEIVGLFVPKNTVIVTLRGAHKKGNEPWRTPNEPLAPTLPVVVLINESSASASEVVSGSLQDLDRALIIGSTSFGKGLVQNYKNLPYRTQMKITTARYHIPSGRCIQKRDYRRSETSPKQAFKTKQNKSAQL